MGQVLQQFAAGLKAGGGDIDIPEQDADAVLSGVIDLVFMATGIICIIVIIIAGIMYATSNGDSGRVTSAKNAILYAVVGLVLISVSFTITGFVMGRF